MISNHTNNIRLFIFALILFIICNRGVFGNIGLISFYIICTFLIFTKGTSKRVFNAGKIIILMIIIPFGIGLSKFSTFEVFKDLFKFLSPFFTIIIGQYLAKRHEPHIFLKGLSLCGITSCIVFIFFSLLNFGFDSIINPRETRDDAIINLNVTTLITCALALWEILYPKQNKFICGSPFLVFFITLFSIYLSGSRTFWLSEIILFIFIAFDYIKQHLKKSIFFITIFFSATTIVLFSNQDNEMVKLIMRSGTEMTIANKFSDEDKVHNYRGYETAMTLKKFANLPFLNKVFGDGFGTTVDVGDSELVGLRYVPITHNGYAYIIIKGGWLDLLLFIFWGFFVFREINRSNVSYSSPLYRIKFLSLGIIIMIYIINASVWGFVNDFYNAGLFIVGAFLYYK